MTNIQVQNNLAAPHAGKDSNVYVLLSGRFKTASYPMVSPEEASLAWAPTWWGLQESGVFRKLKPEVQHRILTGCNSALLNEAYFVEKSGLAYCAKMVLLAGSTDIAQLYALIGGDEAKHLAWIEPFIEVDAKTHPQGQFLAFLSSLIEDLPPRLLVYLVQIILEGWGLDHYRHLRKDCQQPLLASIFTSILKDEALHHRSGSLLFDPLALLPGDFPIIEECLKCYAEMVRIGPQAAISVINQEAGGLSIRELTDVIMALGHPQATGNKLKLLKSLMRQRGVEYLVDKLERLDYFVPMSPIQAAHSCIALH